MVDYAKEISDIFLSVSVKVGYADFVNCMADFEKCNIRDFNPVCKNKNVKTKTNIAATPHSADNLD